MEEVYGYPDEITYGGGYGARGTLQIKAGNYSVISQHNFTIGELFNFYVQLKKGYKDYENKLCFEIESDQSYIGNNRPANKYSSAIWR